MNISFYDGINDGKFFNISAGKYDDLDDIDISEEIENEDDGLPCEDCECPGLEELKEKITELEGIDFGDFEHMEKIDKELSTHLAMINKVNMRLNQLDNKISDLKEFRDETYELQYGQILDRLNIIEKKIDAFKCLDILDKVTKLEEQVKPTVLEEVKELEVMPSVLDNILDRLGKLEAESISQKIYSGRLAEKVEKLGMDVTSNMENNMAKTNDRMGIIEKKLTMFYDILDRIKKLEESCDADGKLIGDALKHIVDTDCKLNSLSDRVSKLDSKLAATAQIVDTINGTISGYGHDYVIIADRINELESKIEKLSLIKPCENMEDPTPIYYDNELKYFTTPGCAKGEIHDSVNHPSHYTDGKYETIDFIEEYGMKTHIGNAIKYASRAGKKDEDAYVEDLKKGLWYLHRYNCPPKKKHIDAFDYCKDKKLPDELTRVIMYISRENYVEAERVLRKYIEELKK